MAIATPTPPEAPVEVGLKAKLAKYWHPREFLLGLSFLVALGIGGAWGTWQNLCAGDACPSIAQVRILEHDQTSKVYAVDGRQIADFGFERRTPVSIHALPPYVAQAVIAIEDKRYYEHGGFDPRGILRAAYGVLTFRNLGGGSTITQQLARNMFDEIGFERRAVRKAKEIQVALDLERAYTKDAILEYYLNEIWMGRGYGFQTAARSYLGPARGHSQPSGRLRSVPLPRAREGPARPRADRDGRPGLPGDRRG
jgi:penicillin-binding protein 1A